MSDFISYSLMFKCNISLVDTFGSTQYHFSLINGLKGRPYESPASINFHRAIVLPRARGFSPDRCLLAGADDQQALTGLLAAARLCAQPGQWLGGRNPPRVEFGGWQRP